MAKAKEKEVIIRWVWLIGGALFIGLILGLLTGMLIGQPTFISLEDSQKQALLNDCQKQIKDQQKTFLDKIQKQVSIVSSRSVEVKDALQSLYDYKKGTDEQWANISKAVQDYNKTLSDLNCLKKK